MAISRVVVDFIFELCVHCVRDKLVAPIYSRLHDTLVAEGGMSVCMTGVARTRLRHSIHVRVLLVYIDAYVGAVSCLALQPFNYYTEA